MTEQAGDPQIEREAPRAACVPAAWRFCPRVFPLAGAPHPAQALARLAQRRAPVLLDSAAGEPCRWSLLGFDPIALQGALPDAPGEGVVPARFASVAGLRALLASLVAGPGDAVPGPFHGGFLGALAYDLGAAGESLALPPEPWGQPLVVGGLYTDFLVRDETSGATWLVLGEEPGDDRPPVAERRAAVERALAEAAPAGELRFESPPARRVPPAEHRARIERAREAIAAGEIYQANLAHRFTAQVAGDPVALYARLREANPAPWMGFARWHDGRAAGALLSSSPELLLELAPDPAGGGGLRARTRPIKGTIARGADAASDAAARAELLASAKDRAELAMIVDLERNDLGRVAEPGSVRVDGFPTLESYAAVHHLVADVSARPRAGADAFDLVAALFPGGSITGAPKLRSMEVIAELEGEGRGFFCGSLGMVDTRGHARFNILIRTLLWRALPERGPDLGEVSYRVGGGITWASDAAREDDETLAKGAALAAALAPREVPATRGPLPVGGGA